MKPKIALLALQGAFAEHGKVFSSLGAECLEIRQLADLNAPLEALLLPGGESTVQGKLLRESGLFTPLSRAIAGGMPVFATCAGLILLAEKISSSPQCHFGLLPVTVMRNAYGRQNESFYADGDFSGMTEVPMPFIRAPKITSWSKDVEILAVHHQSPVAVRHGNMLAMSFHPEITGDSRVHRYFLENIIPAKTVKYL